MKHIEVFSHVLCTRTCRHVEWIFFRVVNLMPTFHFAGLMSNFLENKEGTEYFFALSKHIIQLINQHSRLKGKNEAVARFVCLKYAILLKQRNEMYVKNILFVK